MERSRATWDGKRPPRSIYEVWDFIGIHLRRLKDRVHENTEQFYGNEDRIHYLCNVNEALKVALDNEKDLNRIGNLFELEQLLRLSPSDSIRSYLLQKAVDVLKPYADRTKIAAAQLQEVKQLFQNDVLRPLETYCSTYVKLGITDDHFYSALRSKTAKIRAILKHFDKVSNSLRQDGAASGDHFCDSHFSQELSLQFNCDTVGMIRVVPDLIQKLEMVIATGQDWLRSDKVYVEQIREEIETGHLVLKERESDFQKAKFEYDRLFLMVKQKQLELDEMDDDRDVILKELSRLEAKKTKVEMETLAVAKTLHGCRDQIRDLYSATGRHTAQADDVDGDNPDDRTISQSHSSYKSRLCKDASSYDAKLDYLRRKGKYLEKKLAHRRTVLAELDSAEAELQKLAKKLKTSGRRKAKCLEEVTSQKALLEILEQTLGKRLNLMTNDVTDGSQQRSSKPRRRKAKQRRKKIRSKRSEELSRAFRLVKNNIGHNWKDLARTLPYHDEKELSEIDIEIKAIEYENQGQLKEQAYQSLVRWYNRAGKRASVELLSEALRDIRQNRLADTIEKEVVGKTPDYSETEVTQ
ncbi:hypothetical protein LSH36_182g05020 [Paralvinella palmiformis]|uniref:Death domain-containing protein n=1 Tax=Paralvinella palmiformis TaxID=53620 RepID=A0AAD9N5K3_9ANNE|nr:hypothetical protein LSH36_182g05020 [Paralvinella palmiformis]